MFGLASILGLVTGLAGPIAQIINKRQDLELAKVEAKTNTERARIDQEIAEAENRKAILVAEAGHRVGVFINGSMRIALALGPALVLLKLFAWDKVIGSFYGCAGAFARGNESCQTFLTDQLDTNQWMVIAAVIAFYFAYDITSRLKR